MSIVDLSRPILVYLANGVQGGAVVKAALRRRFKVRALVRDPSRATDLAALGADIVAGDLADVSSLRAASAGIAHAILQMPIGSTAEMLGAAYNALAAAKASGIRSVILKLASASRPAPCDEPSFVANALIESKVRCSGLAFAIVRPTMYLDNLMKPSARADIIGAGVFSPPIIEAQRIAWTSAEDCAEATMTLLEQGAYGGDYRIAGSESVTGDELATRIAAGLGRPVIYRAQSLNAFEHEVDRAMGAETGRRVASKFRFFEMHRQEANAILAEPFQPRPELKGFNPTRIEDWVRRHRGAFLAGHDR